MRVRTAGLADARDRAAYELRRSGAPLARIRDELKFERTLDVVDAIDRVILDMTEARAS